MHTKRTNHNNQPAPPPAGQQLIDSLKSKPNTGFYSLHLLSKTLLSRCLGFSFILGPRYQEKEQRQQKQQHEKSANNNNNNNNITFEYEDILDINIIGAPVAVGDVAACAADFLKHPDLDRTLYYAVENLVKDRRFGVSEEHQDGSFNFEKELHQGVAICKTIFKFIATGDRRPMQLPPDWGEGVIKMTRSRIFGCITRLLCRGICLADWEHKTAPSCSSFSDSSFSSSFNNHNNNNSNSSSISIATFPLRHKHEIEEVIARERKRLRSSSHSFTASQTQHHQQQQQLGHGGSSSSPAAVVDLLCPEAYSSFPAQEGHFLRTTQEGLLHDAMNLYAVEDGLPLIHYWNHDAKLLLSCLQDDNNDHHHQKKKKATTFSNHHDVVLGKVYSSLTNNNGDVSDDDGLLKDNNNNLLTTFYSGQDSLDAFLQSVVQGDETTHKKALALMLDVNNNNNNNHQNAVRDGTIIAPQKANSSSLLSCILVNHQDQNNNNNDDASSGVSNNLQQQKHLDFLTKLFNHPLCSKLESIDGACVVRRRTLSCSKSTNSHHNNNNEKNTNNNDDDENNEQNGSSPTTDLILVQDETTDSSSSTFRNPHQPGIEITWNPKRFRFQQQQSNSSPNPFLSTFLPPPLKLLVKNCLDLLPLDENTLALSIVNNEDDDDKTSLFSREPSLVSTVAHYSRHGSARRKKNDADDDNNGGRNLNNNSDRIAAPPDEADVAHNNDNNNTNITDKKKHFSKAFTVDSLKNHPDLQTVALVEACGFPLPNNDRFTDAIFSSSSQSATTTQDGEEQGQNPTNNNNNHNNNEEFQKNSFSAQKMKYLREFWNGTTSITPIRQQQHQPAKNKRRGSSRHHGNNNNNNNQQVTFDDSSSPSSSSSPFAPSARIRRPENFLDSISSASTHLRLRLSQQVKLLRTSTDTFSLRVTMEHFLSSFSKLDKIVSFTLPVADCPTSAAGAAADTDHQQEEIDNNNDSVHHEQSCPSKKRRASFFDKIKTKFDKTSTAADTNKNQHHDFFLMSSSDDDDDSSSSSEAASDYFDDDNNSSDDNDGDTTYYNAKRKNRKNKSNKKGNHERVDDDDDDDDDNDNNNHFSHLLRFSGMSETLKQFETFMNPKFLPYSLSASLDQFVQSLLLSSGKTCSSSSVAHHHHSQQQHRAYLAEVLLAALLKAVPLSVINSIVEMCYEAMTTFSIQNEVFVQSYCCSPAAAGEKTTASSSSSSFPSSSAGTNSRSGVGVVAEGSSSSGSGSGSSSSSFISGSVGSLGSGSVSSTGGVSSSSSAYLYSLKNSPSNVERLRAEFLYETGVMQSFSFISSFALVLKTLLSMLNTYEASNKNQFETENDVSLLHSSTAASHNNKKSKSKKSNTAKSSNNNNNKHKNHQNTINNSAYSIQRLVSDSIRDQALSFADTTLALLPDWSTNCLHLLEYFSIASSRKDDNLKFLASLGSIDAGFVSRLSAEKSQIYGSLLSCVCLLSCEVPSHGGGLSLGQQSPEMILRTVKKMNQLVEAEFTSTIGRSFKLARDTIGLKNEDEDGDEDDTSSSSSSSSSVWPLYCRRANVVRSNVGTRVAFSALCLLSEDGSDCLNPLLKLRLMSRQTAHVLQHQVPF